MMRMPTIFRFTSSHPREYVACQLRRQIHVLPSPALGKPWMTLRSQPPVLFTMMRFCVASVVSVDVACRPSLSVYSEEVSLTVRHPWTAAELTDRRARGIQSASASGDTGQFHRKSIDITSDLRPTACVVFVVYASSGRFQAQVGQDSSSHSILCVPCADLWLLSNRHSTNSTYPHSEITATPDTKKRNDSAEPSLESNVRGPKDSLALTIVDTPPFRYRLQPTDGQVRIFGLDCYKNASGAIARYTILPFPTHRT